MSDDKKDARPSEERPGDRQAWLDAWGKTVGGLMMIVGLIAALLIVFLPDIPQATLVALITLPLALLILVWTTWRRGLVPAILTILILVIGVGVGYVVIDWVTRPRFEIRALDTLEGDPNTYELTDMLIWNQGNLDQHGVEITIPIEIRPIYRGNETFGKVIALVSGEGSTTPIEIELWDGFDKTASVRQIELTLPQVLEQSGLEANSPPGAIEVGPEDSPFQQARLFIEIARVVDKQNPWARDMILMRNAPWDFRSVLVIRDGRREVDVYLKNLGGTGEFTIHFRLVRLDAELATDENPMTSGVIDIASWNSPPQLLRLAGEEIFTSTVPIEHNLTWGRYLLESYAIKKQNFIQFQSTNAQWDNTGSLPAPWWYARYPFDVHIFIDTRDAAGALEELEEPVQSELERLQDQGINLGNPIRPAEDVVSSLETAGKRYMFENGEMIVHHDTAYSLYGPIWEHAKKFPYDKLGFPISGVQPVISSTTIEGVKMEFEGLGGLHPPSVIYASPRGVGRIEGWIRTVYEDNGGHAGWLGFPVSDFYYHPDSEIQSFEKGYITYYYPEIEGERDWSRKPLAYPYFTSRGEIVDIQADRAWQDTGVYVNPGDRVILMQIEGRWTNFAEGGEWFDANGSPSLWLSEERPLPIVHGGVLIGRIGEGGSVFPVGRWSEITVAEEGPLYLMMNSGSLGDNQGSITVQIITDL